MFIKEWGHCKTPAKGLTEHSHEVEIAFTSIKASGYIHLKKRS